MIILASGSPRRAELLKAAGIAFSVRVADVDESIKPNENPNDYVVRLSREKAFAVAKPGETVLGADTTVVINDEIAGKPEDNDDAARMLRLLSGKWHEVLTAVTLVRDELITTETVTTRVKFDEMTDDEIDWYVSTGEPMDKAGAYAIQGLAARFVERIEGSYSNVVGLPIRTVYCLLSKSGLSSTFVRQK